MKIYLINQENKDEINKKKAKTLLEKKTDDSLIEHCISVGNSAGRFQMVL